MAKSEMHRRKPHRPSQELWSGDSAESSAARVQMDNQPRKPLSPFLNLHRSGLCGLFWAGFLAPLPLEDAFVLRWKHWSQLDGLLFPAGVLGAVCKEDKGHDVQPRACGLQEAARPRPTYLQLLVVEFSGGVVQGSAVRVLPQEPLAVTRLLTEDARLFTFAFQ